MTTIEYVLEEFDGSDKHAELKVTSRGPNKRVEISISEDPHVAYTIKLSQGQVRKLRRHLKVVLLILEDQ